MSIKRYLEEFKIEAVCSGCGQQKKVIVWMMLPTAYGQLPTVFMFG
ncbi:hypothetical protein V9J63_001349 [Vibrio cholerae]